jgi:hypothetical protein
MAAATLSRSKVDLFLNRPRCFWLEQVEQIKQPRGFPFNLNLAVDHLLKVEFDRYRGSNEVPPRLARAGLSLKPAQDDRLSKWRHNFTGVRAFHEPTQLTLFGAIDDLWQDDAGNRYVVDYKATSKGTGVSLDVEWQISYKRQVEFYQWLLRQNGLKISNQAWFVYANGWRGDRPFDDLLQFETKLLSYDGNDEWVEPTLFEVRKCLDRDTVPAAGKNCDLCRYTHAARQF